MIFDDFTDAEVANQAADDFRAAETARVPLEARKREAIKQYRLWRDEADRRPFGWSDIQVPLIFWVVETILPRIGVQVPSVVIKPKTPEATAYAQSVQMRLQEHLKHCWWEEKILRAIKQFLILGDAPIKISWDARSMRPNITLVDWFDWFISSEAPAWWDAEVLFHRTWYTERAVRELIKHDKDRPGGKLYDHDALESLLGMASDRSVKDPSWASRREVAGLTFQPGADGAQMVSIIECWYRDGSRVVIDGHDSNLCLRVVREPQFLDANDRPFRPFAVIQNTPDISAPYGISIAEILSDHQSELSIMRNLWIDQATYNINAPIGVDETKVELSVVQEGFAGPGRVFPVRGNPNEAVTRMNPGMSTPDLDRIYEQERSEATTVSGVTDMSAPQQMGTMDNQTATGMSIIAGEANSRYRMYIRMVQMGVKRLGCQLYWLDRKLGPDKVGFPKDDTRPPDMNAMGVAEPVEGFYEVNNAGYGPGKDYDVEVDAGDMAPPAQSEQAQKIRSLAMDMANNPFFQQTTNWMEIQRLLFQVHGQDPDRFIAAPPPPPDMGMAPDAPPAADATSPPAAEPAAPPPPPVPA